MHTSTSLSALVAALPIGLLVETADRRVQVANQTFCTMFSIPVPPEQLVGSDCVGAAQAAAPLAADPQGFLDRIEQIVAVGATVRGDEVRLSDGTVLERDFLSVDLGAGVPQIVWVYRDITALAQSRAGAMAARDEAVAMAKQRSAMLATLVHEVRAPLSGVAGLVDTLGSVALPAWAMDTIEAIQGASDRLNALLADLLDLGRLDRAPGTVRSEAFLLEEILCEVVEMLGPPARRAGVLLTCSASPDMPRGLVGDPSRLRQVVLNLVANAVKFAPGGQVSVRVEPEADGMRIMVDDDGPGIDPALAGRIFEPFVQGEPASHRGASGGAGLGLAITSQLVWRMGGTLHFEPRDPHGSRFVVRIPRVIPPGPRLPAVANPEGPLRGLLVAVGAPTEQGREAVSYTVRTQGGRVLLDSPDSPEQVPGPVDAVVVIDDASDPGVVARVAALRHRHPGARIVVLTPRDAPRDAVAGAATLGMPPSRRRLVRAIRGDEHVVIPPQQPALAPIDARVLVADDDAATRTVVAAMLAQFGAVPLATESAAQAVRIALSGEVDVVLTDFHLPDSTGTEVVRRIRAGGRSGQLPVAILSGSSEEAERTSALAAGADAFLVKPVTGRELHATLTQLLRLDQEPAGTALEPGRLETLAEETGDPQMVVEVVGVFLAELPARLERIIATQAGGESAGLREAAHALGSPALMIGAVALGEACRALEAGADRRDADALVAVVEGEVPRAEAALRAYVAAATGS